MLIVPTLTLNGTPTQISLLSKTLFTLIQILVTIFLIRVKSISFLVIKNTNQMNRNKMLSFKELIKSLVKKDIINSNLMESISLLP